MTDIQFKRGSTLPIYQVTLNRPDTPDTPLPLAGATVRLVARSKLTGATVIDEDLEILNPTTGLCQFCREVGGYLQGDQCKAESGVISPGDRMRCRTSPEASTSRSRRCRWPSISLSSRPGRGHSTD